jgi:multidrug efflux pump subunit AcrA (membrane-fusion protein)
MRHFLTFRKAAIGTAIAGAIGLAIVMAPWSRAYAPAEENGSGIRVTTAVATRSDAYEVRRIYTGQVVARRSSDLGFERQGRVAEVHFDEGDRVEAGAVLATLDSRDLELRRKETTARLTREKAVLAEMRNGPRKQTIEAARATVRDLEAQLKLRQLRVERLASLGNAEAVSREEVDDARLGAAALTARLAGARHLLEELEEGTRTERIAAQVALVDQLEATLAVVDLDLEKSELKAPFPGRIELRLVDEGRVVGPREPALRLLETAALEARIGVPVRVAQRLVEGTAHDVLLGDRRVAGHIQARLPSVDERTRTRTIVLRLEKGTEATPGEIARLEVRESVAEAGFWLPGTALVKSLRGLWSAFVVADGRIVRRELEVLHASGDRVYVRGTLQPGDAVVTDGTQRIVPGLAARTAEAR